MLILVINAGSSSLKSTLFQDKGLKTLATFSVDRIGLKNSNLIFSSKKQKIEKIVKVQNHNETIKLLLETLLKSKTIKNLLQIKCIGHRVVHGGETFIKTTKLNDKIIKELEKLSPLAPLHNPANIKGILACQKFLPKTQQFAIFDTAFHNTMEKKAYLYGLPLKFYEKHGIRRFGFHGTSHKFVINRAIDILHKNDSKIISCHIGNGVSITAAVNGESIDTSMGFTPMEGVLMGTRSGSVDPGIIFHLIKNLKLKPKKIEEILLYESGLKGISGISSDMRDIYKKSLKKDKSSLFTIDILSYQIAKYCGAYTAAMKGLDAITFTGGIGEKAFYVRENILNYLEFLGVKIDDKKNKDCSEIISKKDSTVKVFVIKTNEEKQIAKEILKIKSHN